MAIYHASTKPIARSAGRSSVAAAAYRAGESLIDVRTGLEHDYTRKGGVVSTEILLPDGGSAERNALWNAAEQAEKRKDARTAREWVIALPSELSGEQRQELAREFGAELASRYGVAVDIAIHKPDREGDNRNHHAHVMTTTRKVSRDASGQVVLGDKADIELSDKARRKADPEKGGAADEVKAIRELWAEKANAALERAGLDARIDHRSLKAQGIDREATQHLGPHATEMERRDILSDRGDGNRQVADNNAERLRLRAQVIDLAAQRRRMNRNPSEIQSRWDARRDRRAAQEKQRLAIQQVADREAAQQKQADEAKALDRANAQAFQDQARIVENAAKKREERLGVVETWMLENPRAGFLKRQMAPSGVREAVDKLGGWDKATAAVDARRAERDAMASRERAEQQAAEAKRKEALSAIHRLGYQCQGIIADEGRDSPAAKAAYKLALKQAGEWKEKAGLSTEEIKCAWDGGKAALVTDRRAREQEKQRQEANVAREAPIRQLCREAGGLYQSRLDLAPQHEELYLSMARKQVDSILSGTGLNVRDVADDFEAGRRDEQAAKEQRQREAAATRLRPAQQERTPEVSKEDRGLKAPDIGNNFGR